MPKIKKFKELSRRQQNRRLLQATQNDNISINFSYIECSLKNQNSTRQLFPEVEIQNIESDDIELDNNIEDSNLLYNNRDKQKSTLHEQLHIWATKYNITQKSLTALLCILREEGHNDLPSDARTLLETPKNTIIQECGDGHYFYYGLEKALREKLKSYKNINNNIIEININIDGLPLTKNNVNNLPNNVEANHTCCETQSHTASKEDTHLLPEFPLSTTEDLLKFEEDLKTDKDIRRQFKTKFSKIGGTMYANKIRNILKYILTDTLCQKLSWTGQKGSMSKRQRICRYNYCLHEGQKVIQEWLRHAGDRINYANQKITMLNKIVIVLKKLYLKNI
ncbi:hypothetical protein ACFW04_014599 [Cataglyphis niger]